MEDWKVYIIQTKSGKLYTGITKDLEKRFQDHMKGTGARFFRFSEPLEILFSESYSSRSEATKREIALKKLSRKKKLELIERRKELEL